jgi:hypothetical protein
VNETSELLNPTAVADVDLGALMERIREQAALRRAMSGPRPEHVPAFNWPQVQACLSQATRLASPASVVPPLGRLRGLTRLAARIALRGFLFVARVITVRQGDVNARLIEALRETAEGLRNLEKKVAQQREQIVRLEGALWREHPRKAAS